MSGNFGRLICRCALVAGAVIAGVRPGPTPVRAGSDTDDAIWRPVNVSWPAGLTTVSEAPTSDLVAAVTADIDADGDLDLVATDQDLNLLVWVNDGAGHLTRQRPRQSGGESTTPGDPALERRMPSPGLSTLNDPSLARLGQRPDVDASLPRASRPPAADPFVPSATTPHRPSRAPPPATILT
ncbi:MAG TPA: VCBS repeat-containing protein [Vicinamibacterales bacterium]